MFSPGYAWNELRRRFGRTLVTAIGLAAASGLVMSIIGVSDGLSAAQNKVLSPLGSVGTDIIVTRTIAPTTKQKTASNSAPSGSFFAQGVGGARAAALNNAANSASASYDANNGTVLTDLKKLGKPGTTFTHDFFFPNTLIPFPSAASGIISKIKDVTSAVGALSLKATHETGTVPKITVTTKTGGQTLKVNSKPPTPTPAEQQAERSCIQKLFASSITKGTTFKSRPGGGTGRPGPVRFIGSGGAFEKCLTPAQKAYIQDVVVPRQTIEQTINPPSTNTAEKTYTVAGVNPSDPNTGLTTASQVTSGTWFTKNATDEVLVNSTYATANHLKVGDSLSINKTSYKIIGLVAPTLTGDVSDIYFDIKTAQTLASEKGDVDEVLVTVNNASNVNSVVAAIKKELPGATVLTSKSLADHVTGSLANAKKLANDLGGALAIVVLLAAFLIAALLTLSSVAKRVREIGTLRAIGWSRRRVVGQIVAETLGIGVLGGILGIGLGFAIAAVVGAVGPGLSVTSTGLAVGASSVSQTTTASVTSIIHLTAPIHPVTVLLGVAGAIVGGLLAGLVGGWRAARLAPAVALRDLG